VKFGMKGHWYPNTPRTFLTSFMFFRVLGHSVSPLILAGLMVML
jgi:hypothetical protein